MKLDTLMVLLDATVGSLSIQADRLGLFNFTEKQRRDAVDLVYQELHKHEVTISTGDQDEP